LEQHWLLAVQEEPFGRQLGQSGSLGKLQPGPQQPSARPHAGQVFEQLAVHVPALLQVSVVHALLSLQFALLEHVGVVHDPLQQICPPVQSALVVQPGPNRLQICAQIWSMGTPRLGSPQFRALPRQ
jgi:hypothetical protein